MSLLYRFNLFDLMCQCVRWWWLWDRSFIHLLGCCCCCFFCMLLTFVHFVTSIFAHHYEYHFISTELVFFLLLSFQLHAYNALHDSQLLHIFLILISGWYVNCIVLPLIMHAIFADSFYLLHLYILCLWPVVNWSNHIR